MQKEPKRILVVDDEPDILIFLRVILEDEGYTVVTSDKGITVGYPISSCWICCSPAKMAAKS